MQINSYSFGQITIDGCTYASDVIIFHDRVNAAWFRKEEHRLEPLDVTTILHAQPDVLIIGTGYAGVLIVPKPVIAHIEAQHIDVIIDKTPKAIELFNAMQAGNKYAIAALHITC